MADCMEFPNDWAKFLEDYSFRDYNEFYTDGARLIPTFRVEQMMHHYLRKAAEDAVHVVRRKDCKHYWKNVNTPGFDSKCTTVGDNDFCSDGERKIMTM